MATTKKTASSKLGGEGKQDLKRVEVYLTNQTYNKLEKLATKASRSTKQFMELVLTAASKTS